MIKRYTDDELIASVRDSVSIHDVLTKLDVTISSKSYKVVKRRIDGLELDTSHFYDVRRTPLEDYFQNKVRISSHLLRLRLLADGILTHECSRCQFQEWQGQPIPLELNHIDGDHENNARENLEILCPNCHALTPDYKGRGNKGKRKTYCKNNHERTAENLYPHGGCKSCKREYDRRRREEYIGST